MRANDPGNDLTDKNLQDESDRGDTSLAGWSDFDQKRNPVDVDVTDADDATDAQPAQGEELRPAPGATNR